ncbi:[FeFe] hydrogenase H-cluster radical SAM maturase HydG [Candidatus Micrarchaeota archaeon]|nr:[FeFe] hydrogenase H-cluster radical SAM maturase HydG [Candidatus Micrarchaeota archaeon]MBU1166622.1 [FeFe] hydrogenase H-cluster radical SAM maturase HydG [Candidatus Micrarchaeota archaeon]MBU1886651.1 [FeFe] hydrogenase H-cluster radical SAM maturase HydG [Candidatus Micrarchaeota archaeon]
MFTLDTSLISNLAGLSPLASEFDLDLLLLKALEKKGLSLEESAKLLAIDGKNNPAQLEKLLQTAGKLKRDIYGNRLVLFAPLYISDYCVNDCEYCGFHCRNQQMKRTRLTQDQVRLETGHIIRMGHKRILLESGEHPENSIDYVCDAIKTIYSTKVGNGEIRRVNVNIAATSIDNYRKLKDIGIGTYQLFQETYHKPTYERLHKGPKADYSRQITAHERAFEAGLDDYGMGVLFGLYDYKFEVLALLSHARYMEETHGVGPHTISVPRFQPAPGVVYSSDFPVSDVEFLKLIAVIRLSLPYTGMIISTRESPEIRKKAFEIGISQTSAASKTSPCGYSGANPLDNGGNIGQTNKQFELSDHRSVDEIVENICSQDMLPSFCTACYRSKRTGETFMKLAKAGNIHYLCHPNAILTFKEFLEDYATEKTKKTGEATITRELERIETDERKQETKIRLKRIEDGERDLFF